MKALIQRVTSARVEVDGAQIGACGPGLLILICAIQGDADDMPAKMATKLSKLRVFHDDAGKMNRSILDTGGAALIVSQFTLAADTSRGNRPGFSAAAPPDEGRKLYEAFVAEMRALGIACDTGQFGADMQVSLTNDGPVTMMVDV